MAHGFTATRTTGYPYGHFDIYKYPQVKTDQIDFLRRVFTEGC